MVVVILIGCVLHSLEAVVVVVCKVFGLEEGVNHDILGVVRIEIASRGGMRPPEAFIHEALRKVLPKITLGRRVVDHVPFEFDVASDYQDVKIAHRVQFDGLFKQVPSPHRLYIYSLLLFYYSRR